ncbi:MAG: hypothetical protein HC836_42070 [Richelia sp. RM2_1_2]|nr:hypothetical protein [Richelia sp. RM1_1_1]NJO64500.1 hypothetical protein [Richelia sp. RM2_1_2]
MAGIPPQLFNKLRQALLVCEQFESDRKLRAIFTYEPLRPWRFSLPQADSLTSRVDNLIGFLVDKHRSDTRENALVLFLRLLSELIDEADERHQELADLASELEKAILSSTLTQNINSVVNIQVDNADQGNKNLQQGEQNQPCAVILTAIPVEYKAVRAHLIELREELHSQGTVYERGKFVANGMVWDVAIVEIGAGNTGTALEAERAINHFQPSVILFVGIAGGIKDVSLGDVVAATKVYGYESGKARIAFEPRPDIGLSTYKLIQRARAEARKEDWLQRIQFNVPNPPPNALVAPIAAGEKVITSKRSSLVKFLQSNYGDAVAVEMEGKGLLQAAHANEPVLALIVRGISDLISSKSKTDKVGWQEIAAHNSSAFAFEILAKIDVVHNPIQKNKNEKSRLLGEISKLQEQDSTLQEQENRYQNDIKRLNAEIKEQENESASLEKQIISVAPQQTLTASNWLGKRKEIAKEAVKRVFDDKSSGLKEMIIETELPPDKIFEGFCNEIEIYLEKIYYYILSDDKNLLEQPGSPIYLHLNAYEKALEAAGMIAYEEIGKDGKQIKDSLQILISNLS